MKYNIVLSDDAEEDIKHAYIWYEEQRNGLGIDFLDELEHAFSKIKTHPFHFGFRIGKVRGCKTKRFPYIILFIAETDSVFVISVLHSHRRPL